MNLSCPNCGLRLRPRDDVNDWFTCPRCATALELSDGILVDKTLDAWAAHFAELFRSNLSRWFFFLSVQVFIFFALKALWEKTERMEHDNATMSWPITRGKLKQKWVSNNVYANYTYIVAGKQYESSQISWGLKESRWLEGSSLNTMLSQELPLAVRYNPKRPSEAVLQTGVVTGDYLEIAFISSILFVAALGLIWMWWICVPSRMKTGLRVLRRIYAWLRYFGYDFNTGTGSR